MKQGILHIVFLFVFLFVPKNHQAQENILSSIDAYTELKREVVFVHLNKSVLIKGENLGFSAFLMDKANKKKSLVSSNLYCKILDEKNQVLKEQLIRVENGIASGIFEIDSLFTTGDYKLIAFTNWMRNFSEKNHFEQTISVIDPENTKETIVEKMDLKVDAQFLPESGQAIEGFRGAFGVIIKNNFGFGIPNLNGNIVDSNNNIVSDFKTNQFGIGRFLLNPQKNQNYFAKYNVNGKSYQTQIEHIKPFGETMKIDNLNDKIGITVFKSSPFENKKSLDNYYLTIHNGDSIKSVDLKFLDKNEIIKIIPKQDLFNGINIITLFNSKEKPILERLYFNLKETKVLNLKKISSIKNKDSVSITMNLTDFDKNLVGNLSISVLPVETISYGNHENIISATFLRPYVNGPIENSTYYFKNINDRKRYDLDNLLITQGWSSYHWNTIKTKTPRYLFDFERGISYTATVNRNKGEEYFQYPTNNNNSKIFSLKEEENKFTEDLFFPSEKEKLLFSQIGKERTFEKPSLYIQFKPSSIPNANFKKYDLLGNRKSTIFNPEELSEFSFKNFPKVEQLDEVVVREKKRKTRIEKIKDLSYGTIDFFEADDNRRSLKLGSYLSRNGYLVNDYFGQFTIKSFRNGGGTPAIFLDGLLLQEYNYDILNNMSMLNVDYVEFNKSGLGSIGQTRGREIIKIFTDPHIKIENKKEIVSSYDIPLTFTTNKRFYTPIYSSYTSDFFKNYGTIDWHPNVTVNTIGQAKLTIPNTGLSKIKLFVEGIVGLDKMVSETIEFSIE